MLHLLTTHPPVAVFILLFFTVFITYIMFSYLFGQKQPSTNIDDALPKVVIIGGSFAGLQCAMALTKDKNIHVTVLEQKVTTHTVLSSF